MERTSTARKWLAGIALAAAAVVTVAPAHSAVASPSLKTPPSGSTSPSLK